MKASLYLNSFGWKEGEALQKGGIKKPILVKHKKDTKGLGFDGNDTDMWWERLFDGQLKNLEVSNGSSGVSFKRNLREVESFTSQANSPLYKMFVRGEGLAGTVGKIDNAPVSVKANVGEVLEIVERQKKNKKERKEKKKKSPRLKVSKKRECEDGHLTFSKGRK